MTASLRFQAAVLAAVLCIGLFFALKQVILPTIYEPLPSYEEAAGMELARMSPTNLEVLLRRLLEKVRNGGAISHEKEEALRDIRKDLIDNMADQPELLATLLGLIDEIILLNDELIYSDDGESRTDEDS